MEELISRITEAVGIDESLAQTAIETVLNLLSQEGDEGTLSTLRDAIPDLAQYLPEGDSGGGGLLGSIASIGGAMGAMNELTSNGLDMGQIQGLATETVGFLKEKAGDDVVDEIVGQIPGLSQFV